jgi:F0F1-type ATP synthase membrane subunit a
MDAPILISHHWDIELHVHTIAFDLVIGVMLAYNLIGKCDQPITYALRLFNNVEQNCMTT